MEDLMRALALLVLAASCGDPIVDTSYRGEPIWYVEGTISAPDQLDGLDLGDEVRASLFWIPNLSQQEEPVMIEQTSVTAEIRFPATFEVRVFEPPAFQHFVESDYRYAAALLLIYVDEDRDGFYGGFDYVVGGTFNKVLVFAREMVPATDGPTNEDIPIGFSLIQPPLKCPSYFAGPPGPPLDVRIPDGGSCEVAHCPSEWRCNVWGWCEPQYPLTIQVRDFVAKDVLCLPM
jgi:hypothetical protein